jgi:hypothetical protein
VFKDISMSFAHDFIQSLQREEATDLSIWVFCKALTGEDDISWKYVRLLGEFVDKCNLEDNKAVREIFSIIYPNRTVGII